MAKLEPLMSKSEFSLRYEFVEDLIDLLRFVPGRQVTLSIQILSIFGKFKAS